MNKKFITLIFLVFTISQTNGQNMKVIRSINDLSLIEENSKLGIIDNHSNYVVKPDNYTKIEYDKDFDLYRCFKENGFEICFANAKKVISNYLFTDILESDGNNTYKIKGKDGIGYIKNMAIMIPPVFDNIKVEVESYFDCCLNYIVEKGDKKGLYIGENLILKPEYDEFIKDKEYDHFIVVKNKKKGLVYPLLSEENEIIEFLPPIYTSIELIDRLDNSPLYLVSNENKSGLFLVTTDVFPLDKIKSSAFFVIPPNYTKIQWNKKTVIDDFAESVYVVPVKKQGYLLFLLNNPSAFLETKEVIFSDYLPVAIKGGNGKFQLISFSDEIVIDDTLYDEITIPNSGVIALEKDNKWGGIFEGVLIPLKYNTLEELKVAYENGEY